MRIKARMMATVLAFALLLMVGTACSPASPSSQQSSSAPDTASATPLSSSVKSETEPIKIAAVAPMTGDVMQYGLSIIRGIETAVDEFNNEGGLDGRMVEVIAYDDKNDAKETVNLVNQILDDPDIWCVMGPFSSTCSMAVSPTLQKNEIIHFAVTSSHPDATSAGDWIFQGAVTQSEMQRQYADFAYNELGTRKVGIIYLNNDWGKSVSDKFTAELEKLGGEVVLSEPFIEGATKDYTPMLSKIKGAGVDTCFAVAQYNDTATIINQMATLEMDCIRLIADASMRSELFELTGEKVEGVYGLLGFFLENPAPRFQEFRQKMMEKTGREIDASTVAGYENMNVILEGLRRCGEDKYAIRDYMINLDDFDGIGGVWGFNETRGPTKPQFRMQAQNGVFVRIG